jgi:hypothetical protein
VGGERPSLVDQGAGHLQRLRRRQRLLRDRFDADRAVRQRAAERVPGTRLARATGGVPVPIAGHDRLARE